ncbi:MAG TPA: flagellar hook protein FlgE [Acidobacteriota bacterium]|nr:flagellar hook protein FlgE [Acidobacteriota bacterium]
MGTSSFYSALAGLNSNRTAIDVIGNNLANLNTIGFKKSFFSFADVFGESLAGSVNGAGNPMEIGLGSRIAAIDQVFSQGSLRSSGEATDMAIQGAGFFMLSGPTGTSYTRAGNFSFDSDGYLVAPTGKYVLGFLANTTGEIITSTSPQAINISNQVTSKPNATTSVFMTSILDADAPADLASGEFTTPIRVFDSLGVAHNVQFVYRRFDTPTAGAPAGTAVSWGFDIRMDAQEVLDAGGTPVGVQGQYYSILTGALVPAGASLAGGDFQGEMHFDANGQLLESDFSGATQNSFPAGSFDINNLIDPNGIEFPGGAFTLASGATNVTWSWDLFNEIGTSNINCYATEAGSATSSTSQNGFGVGSLNSVIVEQDGTITGLFSNGDVRPLAQVALANFNNAQGLLATGNNEYIETPGSGQPAIGMPESGGRGAISGSTLELSNVDLAEEFTNLILSERGFQANSRVIVSNDTLLQEAINLVR